MVQLAAFLIRELGLSLAFELLINEPSCGNEVSYGVGVWVLELAYLEKFEVLV